MNVSILSMMFLFTAQAFAGSQSYKCVNEASTIAINGFQVGNMATVEFKGVVSNGKTANVEKEVLIQPEYANGQSPASLLQAIPTGNKIVTFENCEVMHVVQADGTECHGRQAWDIVTEETYLFSYANGNPVFRSDVEKAPGKTDRGYIRDRFTCTDSGVTTAGGCFAENDSKLVEWRKVPCKDIQ